MSRRLQRKSRIWVIIYCALLLRLRHKQVLLLNQMLRVSIHQSYLLLPARSVVLDYLTRKPLLYHRNLSILIFLDFTRLYLNVLRGCIITFVVFVYDWTWRVLGVLKLPFINFAYDENEKGAAQVLL